MSLPKFRVGETLPVEIVQVTYESIKIKVNFWEQAIAYAVIVESSSSALLSIQVIDGYDQNNV